MTVLTQNPDPKSVNPNHDLNQDTHSTADMVCILEFDGSKLNQTLEPKGLIFLIPFFESTPSL